MNKIRNFYFMIFESDNNTVKIQDYVNCPDFMLVFCLQKPWLTQLKGSDPRNNQCVHSPRQTLASREIVQDASEAGALHPTCIALG